MFELSSYDIKVDLINELKDYLPTLTDLVRKIKSNKAEGGHLEELYRLVETIRGASSLVKLDTLSKTASEFLNLLEDIIAKKMEINPRVSDAIQLAIQFFDEYTISEDGSESENIEKSSEVIEHLRGAQPHQKEVHGLDPLLELSGSDDGPEDPIVQQDEELGISANAKDEDAADPKIDEAGGFLVPAFEDQQEDFLYLEDENCNEFEEDASEEDDDEWDDIDLPEEELLEGFYQEAEDHFQNLGNALARMEGQISGPTVLTSDHKELLRLIRRAVHTIKGAAAVIRLSDIAAWGHEFEDVLDWLFEQAEQIDPNILSVVADAADMLERFVSTPQRVDDGRLEELRVEFKNIIGQGFAESALESGLEPKLGAKPEPDAEINPEVVHRLSEISSDEYSLFEGGRSSDFSSMEPVFPVSLGKTLRVEMGKIESLVNLTSELIIALGGFDENISNLDSIIGELDRCRMRLKGTARDLESGYELKAIRNLNSSPYEDRASGVATTGEYTDFDLLELDRYSEFNLLIRSLNETAVDVNTISSQLSHVHRGFKSYFNRLRILLSDLQEKVMRVRMTPMASIVNRLRSTVRETAAKLQKNVRLAVSGEEIELDKRVWETLADPLMHLLRNAIDHGIEPPDRREALSKQDLATIKLTAAYQGNQVLLRVIDDGAGLDFDAIRKRAVELKLDVEDKEDDDLAQLIFHQGFSTREDISEISGRGVGLDVVQDNISALKGSVRIEKTEPGSGTSILIRIPLTLAVMRSLIFEVNGRHYATALYDIQEMLRIHPRDLEPYQGKAVRIGERVLPFYRLSQALPVEAFSGTKREADERMLVLVINTGTWQGAVAIDRMHNQKEIVVKSLGSHLHHVRGVAGATIMGDGKVIPILNLEELLRAGPVQYRKTDTTRSETIEKPLEILIVDDSVSVRMVISRLMQRQGWGTQTAKDGVEAVEILHQYEPDLIVLDIEMPRMNGYEFMRSFRSRDKFAQTPVIMLTSRSARKHRDRADNLGVNAFLVKPYEDSFFIDLVKKLTGLTPAP